MLLAGDQPAVCQDRRWVTFMWSYPNMIPLGPAAIRQVVKSLKPVSPRAIQCAIVSHASGARMSHEKTPVNRSG